MIKTIVLKEVATAARNILDGKGKYQVIMFDRFNDGKKHILTMSYDDGAADDRRVV